MPDREKVLNDLQELCEYLFNQYKYCCKGDEEKTYNRFLAANNALNLLKNEPNAPTVTAPTSPTYFRLMAIKDELETENKTLKEDVKELRRLTGSLTNLCENLLKG